MDTKFSAPIYGEECESELIFDDSGACCCCDSHDHGYNEKMSFTSQISLVKQIWEQWSELQQVLALYTLLRSTSTHATTAHLMMANMLYAHHNSDYTQHIYQQANDPVWVANMEAKCVEEGSLEIQPDDTADNTDRRESTSSLLSERRESYASGVSDRRESTASSDRRDSTVSEYCERERIESCGSEELEDKPPPTDSPPLVESLNDLLLHLPLLHTSNTDTKIVYLAVIAKVVCISLKVSSNNKSLSSENGENTAGIISQKTKQLVTYAMLHPCVTPQERKSLMACLHSLNSSENPSSAPEDHQHKWSDLESGNLCSEDHHSPRSNAGDDIKTGGSDSNAPCNLSSGPCNTTAPTCSVSPYASTTVTPAIRDVGAWLKSLRLHKYDWLVGALDYNQLLNLDDETLEAKGVTKGARHKLLLSIARLGQREQQLQTIEKELQSNSSGCVESALNQLKSLVITPMPPSQQIHKDTADKGSSDGRTDLPSLFTRILGRVVSAVAVGCTGDSTKSQSHSRLGSGYGSSNTSNTSLTVNLVWLLDKCLQHESFVDHHKRLWLWRSQLMLPTTQSHLTSGAGAGTNSRHHRNRRWSHQFEYNQNTHQLHQHLLQQQQLQQQMQQQMQQQHQLFLNSSAATFGTMNLLERRQLYRPPAALASPSTTIAPQSPYLFSLWGLLGSSNYGRAPALHQTSLTLTPPAPSSTGLLSPQPFMGKRPSLQEPPSQLRPHISLQRTRSAPSRPHQPHPPTRSLSPGHTPPPHLPHTSPPPTLQSRRASHPDTTRLPSAATPSSSGPSCPASSTTPLPPKDTPPTTSVTGLSADPPTAIADDDLTNRLETLCLSVTQHALE